MMKSVVALLGAASLAAAHTTVYNILVNDVNQGLGNSASGYIRSPPNNNPITDVTTKDMACNINGDKATAKFIEVSGGDKITFEWHHNDASSGDDIIADSHKGPILTYIAPAKSNGQGAVWIKLAEEGYANGKWAVDNLLANRGKHSITLPDLAAGDYLLRPEIIALHEGDRVAGAQFYMECVQVRVKSSGSKTLPAGVSFPGAYTAQDAGILFDIYSGFSSYPIPGPKVWNGVSGGAAPAPVTSAAPVKTTAAPAKTSSAAPRPTTMVTSVVKVTTTVAPAQPTPTKGATGLVASYQQCGGQGYTGATACANGWVCKEWNAWYFQCIPSA